ncbi:MAG: glycosyltransferase family 4 protein [Armatimonadota bacterium]|nr:MAG: glycosyltransferase family 4 protein [Armatimonadota bacterium]
MHIAHLTYTYFPLVGGGDVYVENLRRALEADGHEQIVLARRSHETAPWFVPVPNPLRHLPAEFWTHVFGLIPRASLLRAQDAIIAHYPVYALAAMAVLGASPARRIPRPRTIGVSHGVTWDDRPGSARAWVKRAIAGAAFRRCAAFVANDSNFLREMGLDVQAGRRFFEEVAPGRWFIPNCVDTERFRPAEGWRHLREMRPIIVPRNLFFNRGVHVAIKAFAQFQRHHPYTRLVIVGAPSQPDYVRALRVLVRRLGLSDDVVFWGAVAHADMPAVYAAAEMVVIPSVAGEGTSLSALEAMACGVATVSTDVGGLADLPTVQCAPDAGNLGEALVRSYAMRAEIGGQQLAAVRRTFTRERWEDAWARVISSLE